MNNMKSRGSGSSRHQPRRGGISSGSGAKSTDINSSFLGSASEVSTNDDDACVVCFKNVEIYSIGDCDHPVCYECSTRMRVLCEQNECPICRHVLSKVLFTVEKLPYRELEASNRSDLYSKKFRIAFSSPEIQQKFFQLLDHPCPKCEVPPYRNFQALRNHVYREHSLWYCDLCIDNLKIFTFERRCYTKAELQQHNTKGDPDNRSHRGHPLCEYCNKRYVDRDELFRHLRREHFFCHFCDANGCNEFYNVYDDLAQHFRQAHFLCEEGKCATEQFTGAFPNEIEYKAHVASVHGKSLNKHQAKQTRTLQLEITLGPRKPRKMERNDETQNFMDEMPSTSTQRGHVNIDAGNQDEFPLLGGVTATPNVSLVGPPPPSMRNLSGTSGLARTKENFPALGGGGVFKKPLSASGNSSGAARTGAAANGMVLHVSNRPGANSGKKSTEIDFPALSGGKGKKSVRNLEEDMLPNSSGVPITNVAAKHRTLVEDYVSVANPSTYQKLQMVHKEEMEAKLRLEAQKKIAPKLTNADFPTLGPSSNKPINVNIGNIGKTTSLNWSKPISEKKQRELENRKAKVAPAPILTTAKGSNNNSIGNGNKSNNDNQLSKKDKKSKDKKHNQENQPKVNGPKQKEKNNNEQKQVAISSQDSSSNTTRVPPGFNSSSTLQPPPGFMSNVTVNSVAKLPNNLTFTSSLGETYNVIPSTHKYSDPEDITARNQRLVDQLSHILKSPEALTEFRCLSQKFRNGTCNGQAYYEHCQAALNDKFYKLFPELLAMLPDIAKQQELYLVHQQHINTLTPSQRKSLASLEVCSTCKQVVLASDAKSHRKEHDLKKKFPTLGSASSNGVAGAQQNSQRK
ncbi:E3 ubiquitin-protein ligase ZNF598 isoform X2 [Scaptodrosophila lebanonensis]|uniref:RING-type E3 ubiquitin transferase n=1 Tax=Drosophila lebanonensis TaxID=7225 RepID=A0A6J2T109_DROLE|nr:E3 ubiquitin-protein ligase ZNF598 isoform X2 [Scaptodrosophila lebanonensis]